MTATPPVARLHPVLRASVALLGKGGGFLRDSWLMIGIALLLFLGLEGLYRVQAAIRSGPRPARAKAAVDSTLHPYAREAWWVPFRGADGHGVRNNRFDLYRAHVNEPASSKYVNIDSAGRRITPQPRPSGPAAARQVFTLGGSAMWGYTARDSFTIPAFLATELHARGVTDVEVVNLSQVGYTSTQDAITLLLELAHGRVPAAVVAFDGFNDIATAQEFGGAGKAYVEALTDKLLKRGRRGFWEELIGLGDRSAFVKAVQKKLGLNPPAPAARPDPEAICAEVAQYYHGIARATDGMGRTSGFPVMHFLQPFHAASHKPLSPWERTLKPQAAYTQCAVAIEAEMARDPDPLRFVSLTGMFDAESTTVFVDPFSHTTEAANQLIAARIADELVPLLGGQAPKVHSASP